jgi:hypothetical protein
MSESNDKNNDDINFYPDDASNIEKVWVIDWNNKFQRTSSEERTNYLDALKIFNEKAKEGKNTILYEVQKSISNGRMLKRIPILNSKNTERKGNLPLDKKEPTIIKGGGGGGVFSSRKSRFFILLAIIVGFIVTLYVLNIMASGGTATTGHHMILEIVANNSRDVTIMMPCIYEC